MFNDIDNCKVINLLPDFYKDKDEILEKIVSVIMGLKELGISRKKEFLHYMVMFFDHNIIPKIFEKKSIYTYESMYDKFKMQKLAKELYAACIYSLQLALLKKSEYVFFVLDTYCCVHQKNKSEEQESEIERLLIMPETMPLSMLNNCFSMTMFCADLKKFVSIDLVYKVVGKTLNYDMIKIYEDDDCIMKRIYKIMTESKHL